MNEDLIISLRVADTRYPLKIKRKDEEVYRRAAEEIDYKLGQYKNYFTGGSQSLREVDYMAMAAIQVVAGKAEHEMRAEEFESRLRDYIKELDEYLQRK